MDSTFFGTVTEQPLSPRAALIQSQQQERRQRILIESIVVESSSPTKVSKLDGSGRNTSGRHSSCNKDEVASLNYRTKETQEGEMMFEVDQRMRFANRADLGDAHGIASASQLVSPRH